MVVFLSLVGRVVVRIRDKIEMGKMKCHEMK